METPLIDYLNTLSGVTSSEIYLISCRKKYPFKEIFSSIPESKLFKAKSFRWILGQGETKFLTYLKKTLGIRTILFFNDEYPIKVGNKVISLDDGSKILAINLNHARKTNEKVFSDPYEPFLEPIYKKSLSNLKAELNKEYVVEEKKEEKKGLFETLFGKDEEETIQVKKDEEDLRLILKNLPNILHPHEEVKKRKLILSTLWKKIQNREIEKEFQEIIEKNPWILGEEYFDAEVTSTKKIDKDNSGGKSGIPDVRLYDPFRKQSALFELKRPINIIKKDSRRKGEFSPNAQVLDAIWQGIRYMEEIHEKTGEYPKVFVILGFGFPEERKTLNILHRYFPLIEVLTYKQVYARSKKSLDSFRPRRGLRVKTEKTISKLKRLYFRFKKYFKSSE